MNPLRIVFAGTPEFALPSLKALAATKHQLLAVYTQPDRPAGRGRLLTASPVKEWALAHQLAIYQPLNFRDPETVDELRQLKPDVMVVIAYGLILPKAVLDVPQFGCINVHASLLPRWRGASPIQHAILHGDEQTGITVMQMDAGMDTGDMLMQAEYTIKPTETAGSLHDRLASLAVIPLLRTLEALAEQRVKPIPQDNTKATYAPKINKQDALIDWNQPAILIERQIRAFNPWPVAYTHAHHAIIRIYEAEALKEPCRQPPGKVLAVTKEGLQIATGEGVLAVTKLQFPGSKALRVSDWVNAQSSQSLLDTVLR